MERKKTKVNPSFMRKIGIKGGKALFKKVGSEGMSKRAKKRWDKAKK